MNMSKIVKFLLLMFAGCAFVVLASFVFTNIALADRAKRDTFEYIGNAGTCMVYHKRHNNGEQVFVTWGTHCAISAT